MEYLPLISLSLGVWWLARRRFLPCVISTLAGLAYSFVLALNSLTALSYHEDGPHYATLAFLFIGIHALLFFLTVGYYSSRRTVGK